eukprot:NODE_86_length_22075_cov_1.190253.p5 type:complete len:454 gc:universal NODE_86_length_22075_cov_1.190253:8354-9715(+)
MKQTESLPIQINEIYQYILLVPIRPKFAQNLKKFGFRVSIIKFQMPNERNSNRRRNDTNQRTPYERRQDNDNITDRTEIFMRPIVRILNTTRQVESNARNTQSRRNDQADSSVYNGNIRSRLRSRSNNSPRSNSISPQRPVDSSRNQASTGQANFDFDERVGEGETRRYGSLGRSSGAINPGFTFATEINGINRFERIRRAQVVDLTNYNNGMLHRIAWRSAFVTEGDGDVSEEETSQSPRRSRRLNSEPPEEVVDLEDLSRRNRRRTRDPSPEIQFLGRSAPRPTRNVRRIPSNMRQIGTSIIFTRGFNLNEMDRIPDDDAARNMFPGFESLFDPFETFTYDDWLNFEDLVGNVRGRDSGVKKEIFDKLNTIKVGEPMKDLVVDLTSEVPKSVVQEKEPPISSASNCVICMTDYDEGEKAILLNCKHHYHSECLKKWFDSHSTCPICRFEVK